MSHQPPGLAIIRVGDNPASEIYVASKQKQAKLIGIHSQEFHFPETCSENEIIECIHTLNEKSDVHGLIVQLPLPKHMNPNRIIAAIKPEKDVDGLHPYNFGCLAQGLTSELMPCTPLGIILLIHSVSPTLEGKHAVVVGASNLVGKPVALLFKHQGCSITILHSLSNHNAQKAKQADILVSATGIRHLVTKEWVKEGAIVIDVGITKDPKSGKITGDVDFEDVAPHASHITPVPGGVGPMTVAYLLSNVIKAYKTQMKIV